MLIPSVSRTRQIVGYGATLAIACLVTYELITQILGHLYFISRDNTLLGGMWAVIATIFVFRESYQLSMRAALSRMAATALSFVLCLVYLLIFPSNAWGMPVLIWIGAIAMTLIGRPGDIMTTGITTTVIMVVAMLDPQHAWEQPIFRGADTIVGIAVGIAAVGIAEQRGSFHRIIGWLTFTMIPLLFLIRKCKAAVAHPTDSP